MSPTPSQTRSPRLLFALAVPLLLAGLAFVAAQAELRDEPVNEPGDPVRMVQDGTIVYTYNAVSGRESLFDREADPSFRQDLAAIRAAELQRLRRALLRRERVESLGEIRERHRDAIRRLQSLSYM